MIEKHIQSIIQERDHYKNESVKLQSEIDKLIFENSQLRCEFKKEARYVVFKLSKLTPEQQQRLYDLSMELGPCNSVGECVVVEHDWPNYADTWRAIQEVAEGRYVSRDALAAQVDVLRSAGNEVYAELQQWALSESHEETNRVFGVWRAARERTPATCLAQVRSDAVRDFIYWGQMNVDPEFCEFVDCAEKFVELGLPSLTRELILKGGE